MDHSNQSREQGFDKLRGALPTAPSSPNKSCRSADEQSLAMPDEQYLGSLQERTLNRLAVQAYPTPPASSSSSSTQRDSDLGAAAVGVSARRSSGGFDTGPTVERQHSGDEREVIKTRRHTAGLNPLSNIITSSSVHASHISSPASRSASLTPNTPTTKSNILSARSALNSHLECAKLTDSVANWPRTKSTPPRTPRALSNDGSESDRKSATNSSPRRDGTNGIETRREAATTKRTKRSPSAQASSPPVGPPKGRLSVKISEARGLKPSYDPYAVCVFEYNEAVARHPKPENTKTEKDEALPKDFPLGGVPINRSSSDIGRSMAIPMKSRQSSTTSLSEQKNFKAGRQVTDPKWDHEAML